MKRKAHAVILKDQPGQWYLVADGCPHARPDTAPFFACAMSIDITGGHLTRQVRLATCEFLKKSDEVRLNHFEIECAHDDEALTSPLSLGLFGNPTVSHATSGDSDGGELD